MTGETKPGALPITQRIRERLGVGTGVRASMPTLDELKEMLGIPSGDTSMDDEITSGFAATLAIVERYLARGVQFADVVQDFEPVDSRQRRLMLYRFPVTEVRSVMVDDQVVTGWRVFKASGILEVSGVLWQCAPFANCRHEPVIRVDYSGGYADDAWPDDLMDAILRAFFYRWQATGETGNTADMSTQGPIRSIGLDGSTVTWADVQASAQEYGAGPIPQELLGVSAILDPYRHRFVTGV